MNKQTPNDNINNSQDGTGSLQFNIIHILLLWCMCVWGKIKNKVLKKNKNCQKRFLVIVVLFSVLVK